MRYFHRLASIWFKPFTTLESFKEYEGSANAIVFLVFSAILTVALTLILDPLAGDGFQGILSYVWSLVTLILGPIISSWIFHGFLKLFGSEAPYHQTFKAFGYIAAFLPIRLVFSYAATLYAPLAFGQILVVIWAAVLFESSVRHYTETSVWQFLGALFVPGLILAVVVFLFGVRISSLSAVF